MDSGLLELKRKKIIDKLGEFLYYTTIVHFDEDEYLIGHKSKRLLTQLIMMYDKLRKLESKKGCAKDKKEKK